MSGEMERAEEMGDAIVQAANDSAGYIGELELQLREANERISHLERQLKHAHHACATVWDRSFACPRCGVWPFLLIEVGGHRQCVNCKSVIEDCCQGAPR